MNYVYFAALIISAIGMFVSARYLIGNRSLKETATVVMARGMIKVLVGVGCGLMLGVVLAVIDVVVEPREDKAALSFMMIGAFFSLSMLVSVVCYKVTLTKIFSMTVSWSRLAKSILLEFLLIAGLTTICVLIWLLFFV